jgi:hypothetical protein
MICFLGAWRHIAHRAGVATAVEPAMYWLRVARSGAREVDLLAVPPDMGLVVADVTVEHPAAQTLRARGHA